MTDILEDTTGIVGSFPDVSMLPMSLDTSMDTTTETPNFGPSTTGQPVQQAPLQQQSAEESIPRDNNGTDTQVLEVGAGPLPTGFGATSTLSSGSTLTEFTKRRNW